MTLTLERVPVNVLNAVLYKDMKPHSVVIAAPPMTDEAVEMVMERMEVIWGE